MNREGREAVRRTGRDMCILYSLYSSHHRSSLIFYIIDFIVYSQIQFKEILSI
ncbi:MAG: hypothetical protein H6Q69_2153 [Firmicutes bacterium]|nr:hypothetical protein [Bacillota bacterium]